MSARADRISRDVADDDLLRHGCPVNIYSLDTLVFPGDPYSPTYADLVPDPEPLVEQELIADERRRRVARALLILPPRERHIIIRRFCEDETLECIGGGMGCCRERVRQLEKQALDRLRRVLVI